MKINEESALDAVRCSVCQAKCKASDVFDVGGEFLCRECANVRLGKKQHVEAAPETEGANGHRLVVIGWAHVLVPVAAMFLLVVGALFWQPFRQVIDGWMEKAQSMASGSKVGHGERERPGNGELSGLESKTVTSPTHTDSKPSDDAEEAPISPDILSRLVAVVGPQATEPESKLPDAVKIVRHQPDVSEPEKKRFRVAVRAGDEIVQTFSVGRSLTVIKELEDLYGVQWRMPDGSLDTGWIAKDVVEAVHQPQGSMCSRIERPAEQSKEYASPKANSEFMRAIEEILRLAGLPQNFVVYSAPGSNNALAIAIANKQWTPDGQLEVRREIHFDPQFIAETREKCGGSKWAAISIAAHEVAHHLSNHMLQSGNRHKDELEADEFAGHLMARMGATLEEALEPWNYDPKFASLTHPPRSKRLAAVEQGYRAAKAQLPAYLAPATEIKTKSGRTKVIRRVPCRHRTKENYYVECEHRVPCRHETKCTHKVPCRHYSGLYGFEHTHDFAHDTDYLHPYDTSHKHHAKAREGTLHEFDEVVEWK